MKAKITYTLLLCMLLSLFLSACGSNKTTEEKAAYKDALTEYYNQINTTSISINSVDLSQPGGTTQILGYLDTMSISFAGLASLEPPSRYEPLKQLAVDANTDFTTANALFHELYSDETYANFDEDKAVEATMYYQSSLGKLVTLGRSLMADEDPSSVSSSSVSAN